MTEGSAVLKARRLAREWEQAGKPKAFYVVRDVTDPKVDDGEAPYFIATDESLEGYHHGLDPIFSTAD